MKNKLNIVMLITEGLSSRIMYHALKEDVNICQVIVEDKISAKKIIKGRLKKLNFFTVIGQLAFILLNKLILTKLSAGRINDLIKEYHLCDSPIPEDIITRVKTVNSEHTQQKLKEIQPDAIVVNGTRIISKTILSTINAPFINTHMGITPKYRGVHGGYWALVQNDKENCGVTVHLVDKGIDTGGILYQATIAPTSADSFNTYPIHQIAKAIPLVKKVLSDISNTFLKVQPSTDYSQLWYHPTIFIYMINILKFSKNN